ncbi:sulfotransferase family 2 domain-containing protein [Paracoccus sp. NGMCC 1.201697]|uniref:Sulfotransferase family 2 domain-containing protein n=1 Tax=Paracoccus broussonetiae subsp. drimophilus TaxID=3373869 RepID=A0ABW7LRU6_9RHOB
MSRAFQRFVIFAEMRTGSNLLEATLNSVSRVTCYGEAFNPYMIGWPDKDHLKGVSKSERDDNPLRLLRALWDKPNHLPGFRYFHDHEPRVFNAIMNDCTCAKIILTRNQIDSFVSTALARQTNQWKLNESETPVSSTVHFDANAFQQVFAEVEAFQHHLMRRLQETGQTAFWLSYRDLRDADVMTGLLHWLGRTDVERVEPAKDQVPQNPQELSDKVINFSEMEEELARFPRFSPRRLPSAESRQDLVSSARVTIEAGNGLIYTPIHGTPIEKVTSWLRTAGPLTKHFDQSTLLKWKREHPGHRSFTVLRHPLLRIWTAFKDLLNADSTKLRQIIRNTQSVTLPSDLALAEMDNDDLAETFASFLRFLQLYQKHTTPLPSNPSWESQSKILARLCQTGNIDYIFREANLSHDLPWIANLANTQNHPYTIKPTAIPRAIDKPHLHRMSRILYAPDYIQFGFQENPNEGQGKLQRSHATAKNRLPATTKTLPVQLPSTQSTKNNKDQNVILIHIGTQKTGSSSIQHFLRENHDILAGEGINFVSASRPWIDHNQVARELRDWKGETPLLDGVIKEIDQSDKTVNIVSGEMFFHPEVGRRLASRMPAEQKAKVKILAYLRRPDHLMESLYKQRAKTGAVRANASAYLENNRWECDYKQILDGYADGFGKDNIIVRPYSRKLLRDGDVVTDFIQSVGLPSKLEFKRSKPEDNPTFSAAISDLMGFCVRNTPLQSRDLNEFIAKLDWEHLKLNGDVYTREERLLLMKDLEGDLKEITSDYCPQLRDVFNYGDLKRNDAGVVAVSEEIMDSQKQAGRAVIRAMWELMKKDGK